MRPLGKGACDVGSAVLEDSPEEVMLELRSQGWKGANKMEEEQEAACA